MKSISNSLERMKVGDRARLLPPLPPPLAFRLRGTGMGISCCWYVRFFDYSIVCLADTIARFVDVSGSSQWPRNEEREGKVKEVEMGEAWNAISKTPSTRLEVFIISLKSKMVVRPRQDALFPAVTQSPFFSSAHGQFLDLPRSCDSAACENVSEMVMEEGENRSGGPLLSWRQIEGVTDS